MGRMAAESQVKKVAPTQGSKSGSILKMFNKPIQHIYFPASKCTTAHAHILQKKKGGGERKEKIYMQPLN